MNIREKEASAPDWEHFYSRNQFPWRSQGLTQAVRSLLESYASGNKLLEIGCGLGDDAKALASLGFDYTGADISRAAIQQAQLQCPGIRFVHADVFRWSAGLSFDVVYEKGLFHGLGGTRRRNTFLRHVATFLRPEGIWITVCGSADHRHPTFSHGAIYLRDLIGPAEVYFEVLSVIKAAYGLADREHDFLAWHVALRRR